MKYVVIIEETGNGYSAYLARPPGLHSRRRHLPRNGKADSRSRRLPPRDAPRERRPCP